MNDFLAAPPPTTIPGWMWVAGVLIVIALLPICSRLVRNHAAHANLGEGEAAFQTSLGRLGVVWVLEIRPDRVHLAPAGFPLNGLRPGGVARQIMQGDPESLVVHFGTRTLTMKFVGEQPRTLRFHARSDQVRQITAALASCGFTTLRDGERR